MIDLDLAGKGARGFYNIYFRTQGEDGEVVYLRPHKTGPGRRAAVFAGCLEQRTPRIKGRTLLGLGV